MRPVLYKYFKNHVNERLYVWSESQATVKYYEKQFGIELPNMQILPIHPREEIKISELEQVFKNTMPDRFFFINSHAYGQGGKNAEIVASYLNTKFLLQQAINHEGVTLREYKTEKTSNEL
jgi:hypothetical protein